MAFVSGFFSNGLLYASEIETSEEREVRNSMALKRETGTLTPYGLNTSCCHSLSGVLTKPEMICSAREKIYYASSMRKGLFTPNERRTIKKIKE